STREGAGAAGTGVYARTRAAAALADRGRKLRTSAKPKLDLSLTPLIYIRRDNVGANLGVPPMKKLGRAFLVLSAGLVLVLVAAAVAAGSQAQTTQKALKAPRPLGTPKKFGGIVERVSCVSAQNCAALGGSLYSDLGGKWKASKLPVVAHTGGLNLRSLDCPA